MKQKRAFYHTLTAQYWGKGEHDTVERILALAIRYMAVVTVVFLVCTLFFPEWLMSLLTNEMALVSRGADILELPEFLIYRWDCHKCISVL